jgi:hypothetical protein
MEASCNRKLKRRGARGLIQIKPHNRGRAASGKNQKGGGRLSRRLSHNACCHPYWQGYVRPSSSFTVLPGWQTMPFCFA